MHNQAGIAHNGGIVPLLKLLNSKNGSLQHNAAFSLYGLAENEVQFSVPCLSSVCNAVILYSSFILVQQ